MLAGLLAQQKDTASLAVVLDRATRTARTPEDRALVTQVRKDLGLP
jgi:hypothetical protein